MSHDWTMVSVQLQLASQCPAWSLSAPAFPINLVGQVDGYNKLKGRCRTSKILLGMMLACTKLLLMLMMFRCFNASLALRVEWFASSHLHLGHTWTVNA